MRYGLLTPTDVQLLEWSLDQAMQLVLGGLSPLRVLEIGVCHGDTARGIRDYVTKFGVAIDYIGVDSGRDKQVVAPFPGAKLLLGDSAEVYLKVAPAGLDWLLVDGCHCINHATLDILHYGDRVVPGGFMMLHDVAPQAQGAEYQGHGPRTPDFGIAVRKAAQLCNLPGVVGQKSTRWELLRLECELGVAWGGTAIYRRL